MSGLRPFAHGAWRGESAVDDATAAAWLVAAAGGAGRRSRHARTLRVGDAFVKSYPSPDGARAVRARRMGDALAAAGFAVPVVRLIARNGDAAVLVTADAGGADLQDAVAALQSDRRAKRRLLTALGREVGALHDAGFVHGDLVPPNVRVVGERFVLLDHDRTRAARWLVRLVGRRNLVQLGRFVVPGLTATDRARVLAAYAATRGLSAAARRRLGRWVAAKIIGRRCRIDHIAPDTARAAGFRQLMRSGGPFDPGGRAEPA